MNSLKQSLTKISYRRSQNIAYRSNWQRFHLDPFLLFLLLTLVGCGFIILASAANEDICIILRQGSRFVLAIILLFLFAQVPPKTTKQLAPFIYGTGVFLLVAVLIIGEIGKGAQRWLDLGVVRFQPSEILKLAMPMLLASYLGDRHMPPKLRHVLIAGLLIIVPVGLIAKQPDLGTALMVLMSGACVIFAAGLRFRYIIAVLAGFAAIAPLAWHHMHGYQKQRVLTFLNPESDPLGTGYHIIQSKIAIGSGGVWGKGWMHGTQSHLNYLPEHTTDFIFAVCGEEFGLIGGIVLVILFTLIALRCLYIASQAQDNYSRLLASGLTLTFFFSVFVNMGMVMGILPVVGIPLPLVSYGGTSMITMMASFGLIMSVHAHKRLIA